MKFKGRRSNRFIASLLAISVLISTLPMNLFTILALTVGTKYTFTVTEANTVAIPDADITITVDGGEYATGKTDAEGVVKITLEDGATGTYKITKIGYEDFAGEITTESETDIMVQMSALEEKTITGHVIDEDGNGILGATVKLTGYEERQTSSNQNTGSFSLSPIYSGKQYTIAVSESSGQYKPYSATLEYDELGVVEDIVLIRKTTISDFGFGSEGTTVYYGESALISCVAKSTTYPDATISYKSSNEDVATVDNNGSVEIKGVGEAEITATAAVTDDYLETKATFTITVKKGTQADLVWSNSVPTDLTWKDTFTNVLSGGVNGTATYKSNDENTATVDADGKVTFLKPGTVEIIGTMPGNANYDQATSTYEITVGKAAQDNLVFTEQTPDAIFYGDTITNAIVSGGSTGGTVSYKSSDDTIATVDADGKITTHKSGEVTITATLAGNDLYNEVTATYDLTIYRVDQKSDFLFAKGDSDKEMTFGETFENAAFGGENSPITYESSDESIASVDKNTGVVTAHKAGTVTITATNPVDDRYNEKKISYKLTVDRATQEVVFAETDIPTLTWGDNYSNVATAKTEISYKSSDEEIATVDGNGKLTFQKAGTVTITATAAQSEQYNAAENSYIITINKATQTVTFELGINPTTTFNVNDNNYINKATTNAIDVGEDDIDCMFSIASGSEFVDGGINETTGAFKIKGAGTIVVNVAYDSNDRYKIASSSYTLTVEKDNQTISFLDDEYTTVTGAAFTSPVATEQGDKRGTGEITYAIKADNDGIIKSIDEDTGELVFTYKAGTATIIATKAEDANYNATTAEYIVTATEWALDTNTEYYTMTGTTVNDTGWFTGNVSVTAVEGYVLSYVQTNGNAAWENVLTDAVTADGNANTITFYVKELATGKISAQVIETIKKDTVAPTASIEVESLTVWEKFLSIISFGAWGKDTADFTINSDDITSKVAKVEYKVEYNDTDIWSKIALDAVTDWTTYNDNAVPVNKNSVYVVYAKVTDTAGNYVYATTNGIVFDDVVPTAEITLPETSTGYYTDNFIINFKANDAAPYSGLKEVSYKVLYDKNDGNGYKQTAGDILYTFDKENPEYKDLRADFEDQVEIIADDNDSDNVRFELTVTDNAGNTETYSKEFKILVKDPEVSVIYKDEPELKGTTGEGAERVNYYASKRVAVVTITGRKSAWNPNKAVIDVVAKNSKGKDVDNTYVIRNWEEAAITNSDDATYTAEIAFNGDANYQFTVNYTDGSGCSLANPFTSEKFVVDHNNPTGTITIKNATWNRLLSKLTFGLWSNESVNISATTEDETSAIKLVEYYKTDKDTIVTTTDLDNATWTAFNGLTINSDEQFTVYLKITDYAGHYTYISSDGYIVDMTNSTIDLTPDEPNAKGYYNSNVDVDILVKDAAPYSGIKKVEYWVENNGTETQRETLYSFEYVRDVGINSNDGSLKIYENGELKAEENGNVPTKAQLRSEFTGTITVDAVKNNSDNVKVCVEATDNAGNVYSEKIALNIDITKPKIHIAYDTDAANVVGDRGFFKTDRKATITITERKNGFDSAVATNGIKVKALNVNDAPIVVNGEQLEVDAKGYIVDVTKLFGNVEWVSTWGATPDEDTHKTILTFAEDANYDFEITYTDNADNEYEKPINAGSHVTPHKFTVDKNKPTAEITVDVNNWDRLLQFLTFGLWKNQTVYISATSEDLTTATKIEYHKTDSTELLNANQLNGLATTQWKPYTGQIPVQNDERFTVYLKVTDAAGNYIYINSDGYIVDKTKSEITLTPDTPNSNGMYNKDVKVLIDVNEPAPYSGIKKVEYWVENDGFETQRETLYSFEYERANGDNSNGGTLGIYENGQLVAEETANVPTHAQLKYEFSKSVTIDSELNNSSNVKMYVGVTDNAGNYAQREIELDIDVTAPAISVIYDNNNPYKIANNRAYFAANRVATVVITERTNHFDAEAATAGIKITAKDQKGKVVIDDCTSLISTWSTVEGSTPDEAKHTAVITYISDANYTFEISYTDKADNKNIAVATGDSVNPYVFTVDKKAPTGTVKVGELGTWDKLIKVLTFGLWSKNTVTVSGTTDDITSPIESVSYYKTAQTTALTVDQLSKLEETAWAEFKGFDIPANEQFTVYIRIVDFAGNTTYISTDGIIVDSVKPDFIPALEETKPEITLAPVENDLNGIYKSDVTIAVKVVDPITGETYSGLKEVRYEITNMGVVTQEGVLYDFEKELEENIITQDKLRQSWSKKDAIIVDSKLNNSNDVKVKVYAVDNADNVNDDEITLKIDITKPTIDITYNNNDGDTTFAESTYFKANRTATIVITERNFNKKNVKIDITNTDGVIPKLSSWKTTSAEGNGDEIKHTATIKYTADGDYTFKISYVDEAGNKNKKVNYGDSLAPKKFTIDKTDPVVSITYDNNEVLNGNYYKAERVATIVVTEHNFETSRVDIALNATDNGAASALPKVSKWSSKGNIHTATISYIADSLYTFDFDYNDKAGNATADIEGQSFYIDKTNPAVSITNIVDESANNDKGNIGFVITATDTNFDVFNAVLTVTDINGRSTQLNVGGMSSVANGRAYTVNNLTADGIYRINCTVVDKAGNAYSEVTLHREDGSGYVEHRSGNDTLIMFSVNRDGSTYEISEKTADLINKYYVKNITEDIVIVETNADKLNDYKVTLNGDELKKNTDYTVTQSGGDGKWMKYTYSVKKELFKDEGEYKLVVFSEDKAKNDAFSDVKDTIINFVVDRTAPIVTITGMAENGRYQTESQKVTLVPTDDGGALKSLIVRFVDEDGKVIGEPIIDLAGEALEKALEDGAGKIEFQIEEGMYQNIQIICNDCAVDEDGKTNTYNETITNVTVTPNGFMIFWANKPLRWGSIAGVILLSAAIIFIIIRKKRKKENA